MIVANNKRSLSSGSELTQVRSTNHDATAAYVQLSESGYCRHNNYSVALTAFALAKLPVLLEFSVKLGAPFLDCSVELAAF